MSARNGRFVAVDVGPLDAIPLGQGRAFVVAGRRIAVFRQRDGRLFAVDDHCPHRGGALSDGLLGDGAVLCPQHGWKIDLASGRCVGESAGVQVHAVEQVGERIRIYVDAEPVACVAG